MNNMSIRGFSAAAILASLLFTASAHAVSMNGVVANKTGQLTFKIVGDPNIGTIPAELKQGDIQPFKVLFDDFSGPKMVVYQSGTSKCTFVFSTNNQNLSMEVSGTGSNDLSCNVNGNILEINCQPTGSC